ncbi:MAG: GAF domain-containing protein, partial [Longimicrobiales bacterium]
MEILARRTRFPTGSLLFHNGISPELRYSLESSGVALHSTEDLLRDPTQCNGPAVLVLDRTRLNDIHALKALPGHVAIVAADRETEESLDEAIDLSLSAETDTVGQARALRSALELSRAHQDAARMQLDLSRSREELFELNRIGMALMTERDHETLLRQIIHQLLDFTCADAGAVFLLETPEHGPPMLRFKLAVSDSGRDLKWLDNMVVPVDSSSLVGHVATTRMPLVVADVNNLPPDVGFAFRTTLQEHYGLWFKSMLTIPMIDHLGAVVGVLQLANRKCKRGIEIHSKEDVERHVVPFSERDVQLSLSLAGQAAVSIENAQLYEQIEHLFESFVKAAVTAIDQRDPTTAGHSIRVATLATDLAVALERSAGDGKRRLTPVQLRELRYAALLHDFGKIGVREDVLVKAKKLPPALWTRVEGRFDLIRCN